MIVKMIAILEMDLKMCIKGTAIPAGNFRARARVRARARINPLGISGTGTHAGSGTNWLVLLQKSTKGPIPII